MFRSRILTLAVLIALVAPMIHLAPRSVTAQEAADGLTTDIYAGACADTDGEQVATLVQPSLTEGEAVGASDARSVATSFSTVPLSLDALLAEEHVIAVAAEQETAACGAVGGLRTVAGAIVIELSEQSDSGLSGVAYLAPSGASPGQTDVSLFLAGLDAAQPETRAEPTTEATADAEEEEALDTTTEQVGAVPTEVTITISRSAFDPDLVVIPVGSTVTWVNQDGFRHMVLSDDLSLLASGVLTPRSGSYSHTFTEPVIYPYHDELFATLRGTVIVEPAAESPTDATAESSQQDPRESTEEPTEQAAATETYVSPTYGFSIAYDPIDWPVSYGPATEGDVDIIGFSVFGIDISIGGFPFAGDALACAAGLAEGIAQQPDVVSLEPLLEGGVPVAGGDASDAFQAVVLTRTDEDASTYEQAYYTRCIELIPGAAMVGIQQWSAAVFYDVAAQQREELVAGLVLP